MNKKKTMAVGLILSAAVIASGSAFYVSTAERRSSTAELTSEEPVTLDWYINYSWFSEGWGENLVSRVITEKTGVSVNFETPSGNEAEKVGALVASDSLPDLVTLGWWEPQLKTMIDRGMLYSFNELAEEYAPELFDHLDADVVNWYTQSDGNLYWYPNSTVTPRDLEEHDDISSNQLFLVRKDIYEAIGSPDMTTREGFSAAVKAAAEMFPEVDGEPLIPIGAHTFNNEGCTSFDQYLQNFLAVPYEKDGELYDRYSDPEYLSWLKMFRQLGEEGCLADDIFIDQRTQMEEKIAKGRYFCMLYQYTDMMSQETELYAENPDKIYIAVNGPRYSAGDDYTLPSTGINGWTVTLISRNCKDPARAIQFLDFLVSEEGQKLTYIGVEGETYDIVDGCPVVREDVQALHDADRTAYDRIYGADDCYWMLQNNIMQLQWKQEETEPLRQLKEWSLPYVMYNGQYDVVLPGESKEAAVQAKISLLWSETLPKLLLSESEAEFDAVFADFIEKRSSLGYKELQEYKWKRVEEAKTKLGLTS